MNKLASAIDKHRDLIYDAEKYIWANPETGYKEKKTSAYMESQFRKLGYELVMADGITGFYTVIDTGREGPEILVLAELDSIICPSHKDADPATGAVHSCGHHAQCAAMLGIAAALKEEGALDALSGRIRLAVVPAEELLEIEYRTKLKKEGVIRYFGGKTEFMSRGYFDGVDLAFMVHTGPVFALEGGMVGNVVKAITYKGVSAHAGGSPWDGVNALYAATCGINAVNSIRETFKDTDLIRVHPIMTSGGDMVNAIPECARLESYVRGKSFEAIERVNQRVNQALTGAALSLGANVEIVDMPGYAPLENDTGMLLAANEAFDLLSLEDEIVLNEEFSTGSTVMGDLSCVMPVVHAYAGGSSGLAHGNDYRISDVERACVISARWQLTLVELLLGNEASRAKKIIADFKPRFDSVSDYLAYIDGLCSAGERIDYKDGEAIVRLK